MCIICTVVYFSHHKGGITICRLYLLQGRNNLQELHELQEEKLLLSQIKSKSNVEKTHRKSIKRASKYGGVAEQTSLNKNELSALLSEHESKVCLKQHCMYTCACIGLESCSVRLLYDIRKSEFRCNIL